MEKFLIIDGNSLIYRAYYALPLLSNKKGQSTGGVFGFLNMFFKVIEEYAPTHIAVAFDFSRRTFRNAIFAEYKGTRKETPPELREQFPYLKEILGSMGICTLEKEGIEGDDIIGTLAKSFDGETVILSGDKDVLQLIDDNTNVWLTKKGITEIYKVNERVLMDDFRLLPFQIIDLKALMGDSSDNIPGVRGIGPKTATDLICNFQTIDNLYNNLGSTLISRGVKEKLKKDKDNAFMSKTLATIMTDCDIDTTFDRFKMKIPFSFNALEKLKKYELYSLMKKDIFERNDIEKIEETSLKVKEIESVEQLKTLLSNPSKEFAFSFEDDLIFSFGIEYAYIIKNEISFFSNNLNLDECLTVLKPIFENPSIKKIVCDFKLQKKVLKKNNINLMGDFFDLQLASYVLGINNFNKLKVEDYFVNKTNLEMQLKEQDMMLLYNDIEKPLVNVLYEMEENGFKIDVQELDKLSDFYDGEIKKISSQIYEQAEEEFNINSPKKLADILFGKLKLPIGENTKLSTGIDVLAGLLDEHKIIELIIRYRKLQKLKTTYLDSFKEIVKKNGAIIHTVFNQMLTSTGRLSSSEPNLQNLPVRDDEGKEIRKLFISRFENGKIISADYNQIELRLLADMSGDDTLINAFNSGIDVHTHTASQIFEVAESEVTPSQRRDAKAVNFGIIYGISDFGLSRNVGITRKQAKEYIERYFESYPKVKEFMKNNVEFAKLNGFAKTIFNRQRKIPELYSPTHFQRQFGERVAMNMPLQGSASDIIKLAMVRVQNQLNSHKLKSKLVLQIHDELIVDTCKEEEKIVSEILKKAMEDVVTLKVKLPVEIESNNYFV